MSHKLVTLFPTLIAEGALSQSRKLNAALRKDIHTLSRQDKLGQQWSKKNYLGGYTSYFSLTDLHYRTPAFSDLAEQLKQEAEKFARSQKWEIRGLSLEMTSCWMNIMPANVYHSLHFHPRSVISGAYYVSVPPESVSLKIEDPRMSFYMNAPVRGIEAGQRNQLYYHLKPKEGSFILFESWLRHEVPPNQSQSPRISISFNFDLVDQS